MNRFWLLGASLVVATVACGGASGEAQTTTPAIAAAETVAPAAPSTTAAPIVVATEAPAAGTTTTLLLDEHARPEWLGTRVLPERSDGFGEALPTPPELVERSLRPPPGLPAPPSGDWVATSGPIPADVVARSSWHEGCPVGLDQLRYLTLSHLGFDGEVHTGEMIVNARVAEDVLGVFEQLFTAGFPIEEMRVIRAEEIDAPRTGDGNVTTSFTCRNAVNSGGWSQHAYGLAVDINPFHNPYVKGDLVIPELASAYLDRDRQLPGMVENGAAIEAFAAIGWRWGGNWSSLKDWMHFSESGS